MQVNLFDSLHSTQVTSTNDSDVHSSNKGVVRGANFNERGSEFTPGYNQGQGVSKELSLVNGLSELNIPYYHHRFGLAVPDTLVMSGEVASQIVRLASMYDNQLMLDPNSDLGSKYVRNNNSVLRDFPEDSIVKSDRYRLVDPYGQKWNGPLRTMGMLRQSVVNQFIGYCVSKEDLIVIPDLKRAITLPPGHSGNMLNKTTNIHNHIVKVHRVFQRRSIDFDLSVSTMVQDEGKYARNLVASTSFTHDVLRLAERVINRHGSFLGGNIDHHRKALTDAITAFCCKNSPSYIDDMVKLREYLPVVEGAFNMASYGRVYYHLRSQTLPDPIKVGNEGDSIGNQGKKPLDNSDTSSAVLDILTQAVGGHPIDALMDALDVQNKTKGLQSPAFVPKYGWAGDPPAADGGMVWNLFHTQASPWLDGELITPPGIDYFTDTRAVFFPSSIINALRNDALRGSGLLKLESSSMDKDFVFLPAIAFNYGDEDLIRQDGVEINVLVDRYDPELDG